MIRARPARQQVALSCAVAAVVLPAFTSCGTATPLCNEAAGLVAVGELGRATEIYAQAERVGEGKCASGGLDAAGGRYVDAYANVALGRTAEANGDVSDASAAYQAALVLDNENPAAREALTRLGQPVPQLREPEPDPPRETPGEPRLELIVLVTAAATAAAFVLLTLLGWILWRWLGRERRRAASEQVTTALNELAAAKKGMNDARHTLTEARTGFDQRQRVLKDEVSALREANERLIGEVVVSRTESAETVRGLGANADQRAAAVMAHLEELADYVGECLGDPHPVRERFQMRTGADLKTDAR